MDDRVISFSIKPEDTQAIQDVKNLKAYCKTTGIKFSYLVLDAINKKNAELKLITKISDEITK